MKLSQIRAVRSIERLLQINFSKLTVRQMITATDAESDLPSIK